MNGPNFLWKPLPNETNFDPQVSPGDPEVTVLASTSAEHSDLTDDIKHFSAWFHAKKVIALCVLFSQKMKLSLKKDSTNSVKEEDSLRPSKERKRQDESLKSVTYTKGEGSPNSRVVPDEGFTVQSVPKGNGSLSDQVTSRELDSRKVSKEDKPHSSPQVNRGR